MEQIESERLQHGQGRSSLHNAIREAKARNKAYQKFKKALDSPERKRLTELRAKQIDGTPLTLKEKSDIKRLEKKLLPSEDGITPSVRLKTKESRLASRMTEI